MLVTTVVSSIFDSRVTHGTDDSVAEKRIFARLQKFELAKIALVLMPDVTGIRSGCKIGHTCITYIHRNAADRHTYIHTRTHKTQAGFLRYIPPVVISI